MRPGASGGLCVGCKIIQEQVWKREGIDLDDVEIPIYVVEE